MVVVVRKSSIASTMKILSFYGPSHSNVLLGSGWGLLKLSQYFGYSHVFSEKVPSNTFWVSLKIIQKELIVIKCPSFKIFYICEVHVQLKITKTELKVSYIIPEEGQKLKVFNQIGQGSNNARVKIVSYMGYLSITNLKKRIGH